MASSLCAGLGSVGTQWESRQLRGASANHLEAPSMLSERRPQEQGVQAVLRHTQRHHLGHQWPAGFQ